MRADRRMDGDETTKLSALFQMTNHVRQRSVRQPVAVIREKHLLIFDKMPDRRQSFTYIAPRPGIDERNTPVRRTIAENLDVLAEVGNHTVAVGCRNALRIFANS